MNFSQLSRSLKESAQLAASEALSFKGFDAMAQDDDYIHTEGLKVNNSNTTRRQESSSLSPSSSTHSTSSKTRTAAASAAAVMQENSKNHRNENTAAPSNSVLRNSTRRNATAPTSTEPPLLPVVVDALNASSHNNASSIQSNQNGRGSGGGGVRNNGKHRNHDETTTTNGHRNKNNHVDSDDDDEDDDDPIMSLIRTKKEPQPSKAHRSNKSQTSDFMRSSSTHSQHSQTSLSSSRQHQGGGGVSNSNNTMNFLEMEMEEEDENESPPQPKKNKSRFLEDLNDRISKPLSNIIMIGATGAADDLSETESEKENNTSSSSSRFWSLIRSATSVANAQTKNNKPKKPPLARFSNVKLSSFSNGDDNHVKVSSSSIMLDDAEMQALAQFKNNQSNNTSGSTLDSSPRSSGVIGMIIKQIYQVIQNHPRESFIVLTMILGAGAYFYSQNVSAEDDVSRP